jgi:hypothetical protein
MSPNGNGGWFSSLLKAGLGEDLKAKGVEWLNVFAVDNVLQQIADPIFVGATIQSGCVSGAKVVRKCDPYERVGALCLEDGKPSIIEYYELTPEMAEATNEAGSLLYGFGVILNYLFSVEKLFEISKQQLPLHIVEKKVPYIDENGVEVRGCSETMGINPAVKPADEDDWYTEYNDMIISFKVVDDIDSAIEHINKYNTKHSEAIITNDYEKSQKFLNKVDAAAVYVNASTRFTDGFEFGFGAEIGISTQKIHARGPMGLDALTSVKYVVYGNGQIR